MQTSSASSTRIMAEYPRRYLLPKETGRCPRPVQSRGSRREPATGQVAQSCPVEVFVTRRTAERNAAADRPARPRREIRRVPGPCCVKAVTSENLNPSGGVQARLSNPPPNWTFVGGAGWGTGVALGTMVATVTGAVPGFGGGTRMDPAPAAVSSREFLRQSSPRRLSWADSRRSVRHSLMRIVPDPRRQSGPAWPLPASG